MHFQDLRTYKLRILCWWNWPLIERDWLNVWETWGEGFPSTMTMPTTTMSFVWRDEIMFAFSQQTKIMVEDLFCWCNNVTETQKRNRVRCRLQDNEFKTLVFSVTNILYLPSTGGNPINEFSLQFIHYLNLDHNNAAVKLS